MSELKFKSGDFIRHINNDFTGQVIKVTQLSINPVYLISSDNYYIGRVSEVLVYETALELDRRKYNIMFDNKLRGIIDES